MKNSLNPNINQNNQQNINWELVQEDFKTKFGKDVLIDSLEQVAKVFKLWAEIRYTQKWLLNTLEIPRILEN